jgi:4-hydroxy-3-polyprenylbenzoate decarboxylase
MMRSDTAEPRRLVVAISGASGAVLGFRALEVLREYGGIETHLVVSHGARAAIQEEPSFPVKDVAALADVTHHPADLGASIASGSFRTDGMLVAPCSIKTLSGVANSYADNLVVRAADVTLKERRRLVLLVRETPLHAGHLRLMTEAAAAGAIIMPPVPAFYTHPASLADVVEHTVLRSLELLGVNDLTLRRWTGRGAFADIAPRIREEG